MPAQKELEFFSYRDHLTHPGFNGYLEHFLEAGEARAVGEATASYFWTSTNSHWSALPDGFQTDIPRTVHQYLGEELKLLVTLRNPVQRVVSAYLHYLAVGEIAADADFEQAMTYGGVVDMGFYAQHLRNWLDYYPLHQVKVITLEADIQARPVETLAAVCQFLSVPEHDFAAESVRQTVFAGTRRVMNKNGVYVAGDQLLPDMEDRRRKDNESRYWRQVISADWLQQLNELFLADVKDLDMMLGTRLVQRWGMAA